MVLNIAIPSQNLTIQYFSFENTFELSFSDEVNSLRFEQLLGAKILGGSYKRKKKEMRLTKLYVYEAKIEMIDLTFISNNEPDFILYFKESNDNKSVKFYSDINNPNFKDIFQIKETMNKLIQKIKNNELNVKTFLTVYGEFKKGGEIVQRPLGWCLLSDDIKRLVYFMVESSN